MGTPIGTKVTAKTGVKKWSTGQGVKDIFITCQAAKSLFADVDFGTVKRTRAFCSGQEVKQQNDGQNFLNPVLAVTTVYMGVPTPCRLPYLEW